VHFRIYGHLIGEQDEVNPKTELMNSELETNLFNAELKN
jgi:hypothetical protein